MIAPRSDIDFGRTYRWGHFLVGGPTEILKKAPPTAPFVGRYVHRLGSHWHVLESHSKRQGTKKSTEHIGHSATRVAPHTRAKRTCDQ